MTETKTQRDPTFVEIVWGQFLKRQIAVAAMWGVIGLLLLAIFSPVIASNKRARQRTSMKPRS